MPKEKKVSSSLVNLSTRKSVKRGTSNEKRSTSKLAVTMYDLTGKEAGNMSLPESVFGSKVVESLLAQAIRVYTNNELAHHSHSKTRGEVQGSTRKIFKQKGTGRARHGAIRAPIFVGGGIALGPKSRKIRLDLPKKMRIAALKSALSLKLTQNQVFGLDGVEKIKGKSSEVKGLVKVIGTKPTLLVLGQTENVTNLAFRNFTNVEVCEAGQINAYEVIKHQSIVLTKNAIERLESRVSASLKLRGATKKGEEVNNE